MSSAVSARPGRATIRKRVPPLWETALGTVVSNLSAEHTDDFVKAVLADGQLRARFTDERLRRATHIPALGDSDLVEIVLLPVTTEDHPCEGDGQYADHVLKYCTVGRLPHWLKGALKTQFKDRVRGTAKSGSGADGNMSQDGRLEFELYEDEFETFEPLIDAYITLLQKTIEDESIPNSDEFFPDEVDVSDAAPGVMPETVLWDAWDLSVNDSEDSIREELTERFAELFSLAWGRDDILTSEIRALNAATKEAGDATVSTVWVRKPRVRLVLHPEAGC